MSKVLQTYMVSPPVGYSSERYCWTAGPYHQVTAIPHAATEPLAGPAFADLMLLGRIAHRRSPRRRRYQFFQQALRHLIGCEISDYSLEL